MGIVTEEKKETIKSKPRSDDLYDILDNEGNNTLPIDRKLTYNLNTDQEINLLDEEDEDSFGHQFSDEDLKHFADELGLDYILSEHSEDGLDF